MSIFSNNRWLSVITLLLLTANIITLALLWTNKGPEKKFADMPPPQGGQAFEFLTHELKLDAAQQENYRKLKDDHQAAVRPFLDSIRMAKDNFFELLQDKNVSDQQVQEYSSVIGELEQRRDVLTFRHFQKLRALCDTTQQQKFDSIIKEVMRKMAPPPRQGPQPDPPPPGEQ